MFVSFTQTIMQIFVKWLSDRIQYTLVADVSGIQAKSPVSVNWLD